jgi:NADPH:quinone reductase-like Zn-dependent oxidoreductase
VSNSGTIDPFDEHQLLMREDSDLHVYRGIEPSPPGPIMGHEFMGEIVEVGNAVTTLQKGDHVVSAFTTSWYVSCCSIIVKLQPLSIMEGY